MDNNETEKTNHIDSKNVPHINAGDMSLEEFRKWLRHRAGKANSYEKVHTWPCRLIDIRKDFKELAGSLRSVISDLQDPEIARSEDHASELLKEVLFYQTLHKALTDFLNATELSMADSPELWRRYGWVIKPEPDSQTAQQDF